MTQTVPRVELEHRHPGVRDLMRFLTPNPKLPQPGLLVASQCHSLALILLDQIPDSAELTAGLRKLLEAKDCFVRAVL